MTVLEDETDPLYEAEVDKIKQAREDVRIVHLRNNIFSVVKGVVELWSADAAVAQVFVIILPASNNSYTLSRHWAILSKRLRPSHRMLHLSLYPLAHYSSLYVWLSKSSWLLRGCRWHQFLLPNSTRLYSHSIWKVVPLLKRKLRFEDCYLSCFNAASPI